MKKEEFLELASQMFDQINPSENQDKIVLDKNLFDEIVDRVSSEVYEEGIGLINDYNLRMDSREVELERVDLNLRYIEIAVTNALETYFKIK